MFELIIVLHFYLPLVERGFVGLFIRVKNEKKTPIEFFRPD
jgi:hypothetical protein